MDKAKKMAEQAQAKLDEAQKQFNAGQEQGQGAGPAVEYDQHGRPVPQAPAEAAAPPHGDPLAGGETPAPPPSAPPAPGVPPTGHGDPLAGAAEAATSAPSAVEQPGVPPTAPEPPAPPAAGGPAEDRNHPSYAPPKLSSGDPLAG